MLVLHVQQTDTGGSTISADTNAFGILVKGDDNRVTDNDIAGVKGRGSGVSTGIRIDPGADALIVNNRITDA